MAVSIRACIGLKKVIHANQSPKATSRSMIQRVRNSEDLGYLAEETLSESFIGGASGVARDLVGDRER